MHRRGFLQGLGALGCSGAAWPMLSTLTLAEAPGGTLGDNRLVVVILRGAMDGLDLVQPVADPAFAALRPLLGSGAGALPLDGRFALHPRMAGLMPLWQAGELAFVHATSTPYRDKRSHFDGQDLLEAGLDPAFAPEDANLRRDGWLNRMLQGVPGLSAETAIAVGREAVPVLAGRAPTLSWMPDQPLPISAQGQFLLEHLYHDDPLFRDAVADALLLAAEAQETETAADPLAPEAMPPEMSPDMMSANAPPPEAPRTADIDRLVEFAALRLRRDSRIAALSLGGWDSHANQINLLRAPMTRLERIVLKLRADLGPDVWGRTVLVAMTEFGRTVRENGSRGTDHGTGGAMLLAGGALRGGQVFGRWPGLAEADLYDRRDLMPTSDVRAWAAWAMRGLYGLDRGLLESTVFPGLDMGGTDPRILG